MTYKIEQIQGVGPYFAERLGLAGVLTSGGLLDQCKTADGLDELESLTGISATQLLTWMHRASDARVRHRPRIR